MIDLDLEGTMTTDLVRLIRLRGGRAVALPVDESLPVTKHWKKLGNMFFQEVE
jgi:hypothetical protein